MNIEQILEEIKQLSYSQGYWGRLYEHLTAIQKYEPERWNLMVRKLEAEKFDTTLDMVLYFEEGKHCHAKVWKIPVTWEMCGTVEVAGDSIEEALKNYKEIEDDLGLPDDAEYVDGSFRLSEDNKDELIELIKLMNKDKEDTTNE